MTRIILETTGGSEVEASLNKHIEEIHGIDAVMLEAMGLVHEATRQWMDSRGEGTWPPLATYTKINRASQGLEPARPLYAEGNLFESATSAHGPYSFAIPAAQGIVFGVRWMKDGHSIPDVLAEGTTNSGAGHDTVIPARPIWPPPTSALGFELRTKVGKLLLRGHA